MNITHVLSTTQQSHPKDPIDVTLFWDLVCGAENSYQSDNWNYALAKCIKYMPEKNARAIVKSEFWGRYNMNHQTAKTMLFARFPEYDYIPSRYHSIKEYWEAV